MTDTTKKGVTVANGHKAARPSGRPRLMPSVAMDDRLHPESYRQLRDLVILHGTVLLQRALRDIEAELVAKYEAEALARK